MDAWRRAPEHSSFSFDIYAYKVIITLHQQLSQANLCLGCWKEAKRRSRRPKALLVTELEKIRSNFTEELKTAVLPIWTALETVKRQVESFEACLTEAEDASVDELKSTVQDHTKENEGLKDTLDGYENRQGCLNLRVLCVAEDSERGQCPLKFIS